MKNANINMKNIKRIQRYIRFLNVTDEILPLQYPAIHSSGNEQSELLLHETKPVFYKAILIYISVGNIFYI